MKKYIHYDTINHLVVGFMETTDNVELRDGLASVDDLFVFDPTQTYFYDTHEQEVLVTVEKPSAFHNWDWPTKSWLPNLDAARGSQRQAWNAWRDRELVAGYAHNGHVFHSDDRFMAELQLILKGYERGHLTGTSAIRTRDNSTLQMTHAEIEGLLLMIGLHRQAIYQQSWVGKDALASLTTLEDIVVGGPPS